VTIAAPRRLEPAQRRLRARADGSWLIDTDKTWLLFEPERHPTFVVEVGALPIAHHLDSLITGGEADSVDGIWVTVGTGQVRVWPAAPPDLPTLAGLAAVPIDIADEWYQEDEPILHLPHDPYRRVDVLASSRPVEITVDASRVAATSRALLVIETGLPAIWYIPLNDAP
jgi:uncharacterized protein (DUF427 family)